LATKIKEEKDEDSEKKKVSGGLPQSKYQNQDQAKHNDFE
jgi:hypothetical protein